MVIIGIDPGTMESTMKQKNIQYDILWKAQAAFCRSLVIDDQIDEYIEKELEYDIEDELKIDILWL